ncbi:DUF1501 domain-containing protein [bacterium]|nr:DUF1501 domain-containing protein [bacterium]
MNRRRFLHVSLGGLVGGSTWFSSIARAAAESPPKRACILLWMSGGPSQIDTFDPKPGHANGGPFQAIETQTPGIRLAEHLPKLAQRSQHLAIIRSMTSKEGDHIRATQYVRTGYRPGSPIDYPFIGPAIGKEQMSSELVVPPCVSIGGFRGFGSSIGFGAGYLGPRYAPLSVGENAVAPASANIAAYLQVANMRPAEGTDEEYLGRIARVRQANERFAKHRPDAVLASRQAAYDSAAKFISPEVKDLFDVSKEPAPLRERYGNTMFGQGCLLARRLVEFGVPFVEVSLNGVANRSVFGWDTHQQNFPQVQALSEVLDAGWSTLIDDLKDRGLLETTTIVWLGEFGRTPRINGSQGRDHFPDAWSAVLGGGGIVGGQVIGSTGDDGARIKDRPVTIPDLLATLVKAMKIDPSKTNMSNVGRPIQIVDTIGKPIQECLA